MKTIYNDYIPDHIINKIIMFASHPVADIINEGHEIAEALDFRIIKDDTKMWFIDYDKEWREQELDEQVIRHSLKHRLVKQSYPNTI